MGRSTSLLQSVGSQMFPDEAAKILPEYRSQIISARSGIEEFQRQKSCTISKGEMGVIEEADEARSQVRKP